MTDRLISLLKASGVHAWEVADTEKLGWEFYFIRHRLDQNRMKNVRHVQLKVYETTDGCQTLGSASAEVPLDASDGELNALIKDLSYRASLVKNAYYTLNPPETAAAPDVKIDLKAIAAAYMKTLSSLPETATEDINSYEIFVSEVKKRLCTSTGTDVACVYPASMTEVIVNARRDGHEIELYRSLDSGECDEKTLRETLENAMKQGRDRLVAVPTPNFGKVDVLFSSDEALEIYEYFLTRLNPAMIFRRFSDWEVGKPISGDLQGDKPTVRTLKTLPGSSKNLDFDDEGARVRDEILMEAGVPRCITGGRMFSCLMGLRNTFQPTNVVFEGGTRTEDELRQGEYLEVVEFSDFQVDPITGDVFGELRLGYHHDGKGNVTPVTGGSVSGDLGEYLKTMTFSRESAQRDSEVYPRFTRLKNVTFAG